MHHLCSCSWLLNVGKEDIENGSSEHSILDLEDTGKLFAIIAASEIMREYLFKQKILPEHINV